MADRGPAWLKDWSALRDQPMAEIQRRFRLKTEGREDDTRYINLTDLVCMYNRETHPGWFYFHDGRLALLYVERCPETAGDNATTLLAALGEPAARLSARSGPFDTQYVYPEQGIAFAGDAAGIAYLEIFPPLSLAEYMETMYVSPGPFIR